MDNQRDGHYSTLADWKRVEYSYCPHYKKGYEYNEKTKRNIDRGNTLEKILPKKKDPKIAQQEIDNLLMDNYGLFT